MKRSRLAESTLQQFPDSYKTTRQRITHNWEDREYMYETNICIETHTTKVPLPKEHVNIHHIPEEMLYIIFSYVGCSGFEPLCLTCKRFNSILPNIRSVFDDAVCEDMSHSLAFGTQDFMSLSFANWVLEQSKRGPNPENEQKCITHIFFEKMLAHGRRDMIEWAMERSSNWNIGAFVPTELECTHESECKCSSPEQKTSEYFPVELVHYALRHSYEMFEWTVGLVKPAINTYTFTSSTCPVGEEFTESFFSVDPEHWTKVASKFKSIDVILGIPVLSKALHLAIAEERNVTLESIRPLFSRIKENAPSNVNPFHGSFNSLISLIAENEDHEKALNMMIKAKSVFDSGFFPEMAHVKVSFGTGAAATRGNIALLEKLLEMGCPLYAHSVAMHAALFGRFEVIKWVFEKCGSVSWSSMIYANCAKANYIAQKTHYGGKEEPDIDSGEIWIGTEIAMWAYKHGCPMSLYSHAPKFSLQVTQFLARCGCEWTASTAADAVDSGNNTTLKWMVKNGCPVDNRIYNPVQPVEVWEWLLKESGTTPDPKCLDKIIFYQSGGSPHVSALARWMLEKDLASPNDLYNAAVFALDTDLLSKLSEGPDVYSDLESLYLAVDNLEIYDYPKLGRRVRFDKREIFLNWLSSQLKTGYPYAAL